VTRISGARDVMQVGRGLGLYHLFDSGGRWAQAATRLNHRSYRRARWLPDASCAIRLLYDCFTTSFSDGCGVKSPG